MSGDGLVPPLNAPPAGQPVPGTQPGVTPGTIVANRVIVIGANGGIFVYSGSPAAGNLVQSITGQGGTDRYGNVYLAESTTYAVSAGVYTAVQSGGGSGGAATLTFYTATSYAGPWGSTGIITANASGVLSLEGGESILLDSPLAEGIAIQEPGSPGNSEIWHAMSPLLNSWAGLASNVANQYRLLASPPNTVEVIGTLNATSATSTTFFTLPSNYIPNSQQGFPVGTFSGSAAADNVTFLQCDTSGNLSIQQRTASQVDIRYHGFISLDA